MDKNIRELIKVRLEKAEEDIETAEELLSLKRYRAAVNRSYYALFSITTAVLLTKKLERSKHSGVEVAFNQYFIKSKIIEIEYGKIFDYVRKKREESDYTAKIMIERETAEKIVQDSKRFIKLYHCCSYDNNYGTQWRGKLAPGYYPDHTMDIYRKS